MIRKTFAVFAFAGAVSFAGAQELPVLLIVDNTDPSAVVISATGNAAAIAPSSQPGLIGGVTLIGLFGGSGLDLPITSIIGGTLSPNGNAGAYARAGNRFGTLSDNDLNLWGIAGGAQAFNTTDPAFSGMTSAIDYSAATFNASGEIRLGDTVSGAVLGTWQLVPSPSVLAVAPVGLLLASRRRRA